MPIHKRIIFSLGFSERSELMGVNMMRSELLKDQNFWEKVLGESMIRSCIKIPYTAKPYQRKLTTVKEIGSIREIIHRPKSSYCLLSFNKYGVSNFNTSSWKVNRAVITDCLLTLHTRVITNAITY